MNKVLWKWIALAMMATAIIAGMVVYVVIQNQMHDIINDQVRLIQSGVNERFATFDRFLKKDEASLDAHLDKTLPELARVLRQEKSVLTDWSPKELRQLADRYRINEIYIIDKSTTVIATSFKPDMGFKLGTISEGLNKFLTGLVGSNKVIIDRINASSKTGILNKYAYYSPAGSSYIFEVSVEIKPFLATLHSKEYAQFVFNDMFTDPMGNQLLLESIDLFIVNELALLPFAGDTSRLIPRSEADIPEIPKVGVVQVSSGDKFVYYSRLELDGTLLNGVGEFLAIRTRFDFSAAEALAFKLIVSNSTVLILSLVFIYFLIRYILSHTIIKRVLAVNISLNQITAGNYESSCDVGGNDEITSIAKNINLVKNILVKRGADLQQAHDNMEEMVAERTRDLDDEIHRREDAEAELNILATTDPLTTLPNRLLIDQYLEHALLASRRSGNLTAVLFMDLDNFKYVNDSLGHSAGDVMLKTIAVRLTNSIRTSDIAGRLGGDEFIILLQDLRGDREIVAQTIHTIAEKILDAVRSAIPLGDHEHHCTLSIGITLSDELSTSESMYKQADTAMYRAKEQGKDSFCFYEESMQNIAVQRLIIEKDLRSAFKDNQFSLNYQPQFNDRNQMVGAEVLIRWQKPDGSFVPPDSFIPVAEEIGFIQPIGDWVLSEACRQYLAWQKAGLHIPHLSVNISAKQLHQDDFVESVKRIVLQHDIEPATIILELTETAMLGDQGSTVEKINALHELGFRISIDDFGTGYSSLNYLKNLPIDQLKIDKSFIRGIGENDDDSAIVNMIISMTIHLNVSLIAEGVEDERQLNYLKESGCHEYQGYLFSKPLSADDFSDFVRKNIPSIAIVRPR